LARPKKLKAPFPYFGGKSRVAALVWSRLGAVSNYIEPFAGSCAVLLLRPDAPKIETLNDMDCFVGNFWRATQQDPEAVAAYADAPVNECDLHANHRWLVLSDDAEQFRRRMRREPDYFDAKVAGRWVHGLCCWIGSGWCATAETVEWEGRFAHSRGDGGHHGVHAHGEKRPKLSGGAPDSGALGTGVHANGPALHDKRPRCHSNDDPASLPGVLGSDGQRPQLADAYSRGRGVHGNDTAVDPLSQKLPSISVGGGNGDGTMGVHRTSGGGTCAARRAWLLDWFNRLRDRLRTVRVCCGDWLRVCDSESVTTRLGLTGIFFDPPYGELAGRNMKLYAQDSGTVAADVRRYCLERGGDPLYRIALCGYANEGHEVLEAAGWEVVAWAAPGGYGNRSAQGKANAKRERVWFSPHCCREMDLFGGDEA
jgi:hypothetical protein